MKIIVRSFVLAAAILSAVSQVHAGSVDPFIALNAGGAGPTNWRVLTMGSCTAAANLTVTACDGATAENVNITTNSQIIEGNVGISPIGNLSMSGAGSAIRNTLYIDTGVGGANNRYSLGTGTNIYGGIVAGGTTNTLLMTATNAAMLAYNEALTNDSVTTCGGITNCTGITANNITNLATTLTITGGAGLNILDLSNLSIVSGGHLILQDSSGNAATFIIDITGTFSVTNGGTIVEGANVNPKSVLFNVEGSSSAICIGGGAGCSGTTANGTLVSGVILAPFRNVTINAATVDGEVITGGGLNLSNKGSIEIPEPATLMLLTTGLAGFGLRLRRLRRHPA